MHRFTILDGVETQMRDGTILRGDVWLPEGEGPWPVLLQRTPYRREDVHGAQYISALEFQEALRRGMAVMVQDTRGRYGSDGAFEPFRHEGRDGADTIAWLRAQPFCNGQVAMFGASYVGATQVLAAAEKPEGLVAISPQLTTARHGDTWMYRDGAIELGFVLLWIIEALGPVDLERRLPGMDAASAERVSVFVDRLLQDPDGAFAALADIADDLHELAPYAREWLDGARALASPSDREHLPDLADSGAAMLVTGGWNDLFVEGSIELFETARARHGADGDVSDRLILGPWSHGNPKDRQGDMWHGYQASTEALSDAQLAFFEAVFTGRKQPRPMVRYFRTGSNTWHSATEETVLYLDGERLCLTAPTKEGVFGWVSDPADPVPTVGGATFLPGLLLGRNSGPREQSQIEARADVVCLTGDPLQEPLEVTGLVTATLVIASSADTSDWTARLCEVFPDGRSYGLVDGILRLRRAPGGTSDHREEITIRLGHIGHQFAAGSRIRLQIASSNFPRFDVNPQTGAPDAPARPAIARQTVLTGAPTLSRLVLPVVKVPFPQTDAC
jgi:putative CocE/NonD family hydrolase